MVKIYKSFDRGLAVERWDWGHRQRVVDWLSDNYGAGNEITGRWFLHQDYDLLNLYMDDDVYAIYLLKFTGVATGWVNGKLHS